MKKDLPERPKILLLSAYHAQSHQHWCSVLMAHLATFDWTELSLPPRFFNWRIRGNSLSWAFGKERSVLEARYDLVVATSMVDLSALRGFCPALASVPTILYFHENQFAYPQTEQAHRSVEPQIVSLYAALCADQLVFNSEFNRSSFLTGVQQLLKKLPDHIPDGLVDRLEERSTVLPVPIEPKMYESRSLGENCRRGRPSAGGNQTTCRLVWNSRWEHDKGPERLLALLDQLATRDFPFELVLLGQRFRQIPEGIDLILRRHKDSILHAGFVEDRADYLAWLASSDLVISTAVHEFQGLAVLEAVELDCIPVVPDRLVYPELFAPDFCYRSDLKNIDVEAKAAADKVIDLWKPSDLESKIDLSSYTLEHLMPKYQALFEQLIGFNQSD